MATLTVYSSPADGYIRSASGTYSTARSGGGTLSADTTGDLYVGQSISGGTTYECWQSGLLFLSMPRFPVTSATLSLYMTGYSNVGYTEEVRVKDFGGTITTADWVAGANLGNNTLVASRSAGGTLNAYNDFTAESTFVDYCSAGGDLSLWVACDKQRTGTSPGGTIDYTIFRSADVSGTTADPKLTLTYTPSRVKKLAGRSQAGIKKVAGRAVASTRRVSGVTNVLPYFQASTTHVISSGTIGAHAWPTHQTGDLGILIVGSCANQTPSLTTANGFSAVSDSPQNTTGTGNGTAKLAVYSCLATSGSMSAPVVADSGTNNFAQMYTFRGANGVTPIDVTDGTAKTSASTSMSITGVTTTVKDCLVVYIAMTGNAYTTDIYGALASLADTSLSGLATLGTAYTLLNYLGIGVWGGWLGAAGASGTLTATIASSSEAYMCLAIRP